MNKLPSLAGVGLVIVACLGVYLALSGEDRQEPVLHVPPEALNLGEVWAQDDLRWTLPIHNESSGAVEIVDGRTSCGCSSVEPLPLRIDGHSSAELFLTLDLNSTGPFSESGTRPVSIQLLPILRGANPPRTIWELRGEPRPLFDFGSSTLDLGEIVIGTEPVPRVFEARCHVPIQSVHVKCDSAHASASVGAISPDGRSFELAIHPVASEHSADVSFPIRLHAIRANGERLPPITMSVSGTIFPDLLVSPSKVWLGSLTLGSSTSETVMLRSRSGRPLQIISARADSPDFDILMRRPPGDSETYILQIRYTARQVGFQHSNIRILACHVPEGKHTIEYLLDATCYIREP